MKDTTIVGAVLKNTLRTDLEALAKRDNLSLSATISRLLSLALRFEHASHGGK